jgi:hypothetical protein
MALLHKSRSERLLGALTERLAQLEELVRSLKADLDARLDEALEARSADAEAEALAAERIRSGAADRTEDGTEALGALGIHPD